MASLPTPQELAAAGEGALRAALDPGGTGAVNLRDGSRLNALVSTVTAVETRNSRYAADRVGAARLASASGDDLYQLARDLYQEEPKAASAATGPLRLSRGAVLPATSIPKGSRFSVPASGSTPAVVFEATETVPVAANATTVDLVLRCTETGVQGNLLDPAAVTRIVDPLPTTVPATTWAIAAPPVGSVFGGGAAAETDEELRTRLAELTPQAERQRGTRDAVLAGARRVPGVAFATPVEPGDGTGIVFAGDAGYQLATETRKAIETELLGWRPWGVPVRVCEYSVVTVEVVQTIHMARVLSNYDTAALRSAFVAAIKEYFDGRPYPDEYFVDAIEGAVFRAHEEVQTVVSTSPAADQKRPLDAGYSGLSTINRYRVTDDSIRLTIAAPTTLP